VIRGYGAALAILVLTGALTPAASQVHSSAFELPWTTLDGGGGACAGGGFSLHGTIGQPDAGAPMSGGGFTLTGGFWGGSASVPPASAPRMSIRLGVPTNGVNTVILTWPHPSTGYVLQQTANMNAPADRWTDVTQSPTVNGAHQEVTLLATGQFCLFRLLKRGPLLSAGDPIIAIDLDLVSSSRYPAHEAPAMAIDGSVFTKYLNFGQRYSGFIVTPQAGPRAVRSFVITTANDEMGRDPTAWALYGTSEPIASADNSVGQAENWTLVAAGPLDLPYARQTPAPVVGFANPTAYRSYRMVFPYVLGSLANGMQIAEIQFFPNPDGTGAPVLAPGDPILAVDLPASESQSPGAEGPAEAIDGLAITKYLNLGRERAGFIVTPSAGATVVTGFTITSANDEEGRDPVEWELHGTRDAIVSLNHSTGTAENWTLIQRGTVALPAARRTAAPTVTFGNSAAYTSYRFVVLSVKDAATANAMQFAEIQFEGGVSRQ
jgi:hypothetical protein